MHVVECPNCNAKFKVSRPRVDAKLKCSACGQAFVGSSKVLPDTVGTTPTPTTPAARPAEVPVRAQPLSASEQLAGAVEQMQEIEPDAVRVHHNVSLRPKGKPWMIVVVSAAMVCIAAGLIAAGYLVTHKAVEDASGNRRWVTNEEAARINKERATPKASDVVDSVPADSAGGGGSGPGPGPGDVAGGVTDLPKPPPIVKAERPASDAGMNTSEPGVYSGYGGEVFVHGTARNDLRGGMVDMVVHCRLIGSDGQAIRRGDKKVSFKSIPAEMVIPYSFDYSDHSAKELDGMAPYVWVTATHAPKAFAWRVDTSEMLTEAKSADPTAKWTGTVRNPHSREVRDVKVLCDFYQDEDGWMRHVGSAGPVGLTDQQTRISPSRTGRFEITFAPRAGMAGMARRRFCRAVGR